MTDYEKLADLITTKTGALEARITTQGENFAKLVTDVKESLERQMNTGFQTVNDRLDAMNTRLERQGALIQSGSRWTNRMNQWSEEIDALMAKRDAQIAELIRRVENLEKRNPPSAA